MPQIIKELMILFRLKKSNKSQRTDDTIQTQEVR